MKKVIGLCLVLLISSVSVFPDFVTHYSFILYILDK